MKVVYVLFEEFDNMCWDDYEKTLLGVFSTQQKAQEVKEQLEQQKEQYISYYIEELEIDKI